MSHASQDLHRMTSHWSWALSLMGLLRPREVKPNQTKGELLRCRWAPICPRVRSKSTSSCLHSKPPCSSDGWLRTTERDLGRKYNDCIKRWKQNYVCVSVCVFSYSQSVWLQSRSTIPIIHSVQGIITAFYFTNDRNDITGVFLGGCVCDRIGYYIYRCISMIILII